MVDRASAPGKLSAKTQKWRCRRVLIVKLPAVGFMHDTYCVLWMSFSVSLVRSYQWL